MYIILKGTADVSIKNKVVKNLESGDFFGEISLIDNAPRTASIMATSDIEVLTLSRKDFYYILTHDSQLSVKLLWMFTQTLATRLRAANLTLPDKVKNKDSYSVDSNSANTLKFD
jgi:CRP-like cAMP-binding protein